ncbi:MAG TPA: class I SAM-dependent methyltransferase [Actinokineospora sp.]|nr:class I SAM-dependent methyltransferase [Actinokineospora sp.]
MSRFIGTYVAGVRAARRAAASTGLLDRMAASRSRSVRHLRTLFAVYDVDDLVALDLAWWSYPSITEVDAFLTRRPAARVFEFGAGASTVWLARRAAAVVSVEHDVEFAATVRTLLAEDPVGDRVELHTVPPVPATAASAVRSGRTGHLDDDFTAYVATLDEVGGEFDLIVVDGRARVDAFESALDHLAPGGLIVFDNITRGRYRPVLDRPGLRYRLFKGATPALPYPTTTALIDRG